MAGISKLMNMGLLSIFGGGEKDNGVSGASIPPGSDNGSVDLSKFRAKPASILESAPMAPSTESATKKSSLTNILGIGY